MSSPRTLRAFLLWTLAAAAWPAAAVPMLALGAAHSCAVDSRGAAWCWGANLVGQLGNVSAIRRNIAVGVSGLDSGVAQIAATDSSTCALVNGGVRCWGSNRFGELGDGTGADRPLPGLVPGAASGIVDIAAGGHYVCALSTAGGVRCWGQDAVVNLAPRAIAGLASGVTRIATGSQHACARVASGVKCWGNNERGQLGNGQAVTSNAPVDVAGIGSNVLALAAGRAHSCVLLDNGRAKCWGANEAGQLGNGTTSPSAIPMDVVGLGRAIGIAAFVDTTCALTATGGIWCWGQVSAGRPGVPWLVPSLSNSVVGIAASNTHACVMVAGGGVRCFGNNLAGQLGDGTNVTVRRTPETVVAGDAATFLDLTPEDPLPRALLSPFVALANGSGSNVTAQVHVPAQPQATTNIYVFALAPAPLVLGAAKREKDDSVACVLAQLNASGQLTAVSTSSLQAYATGVATGQSQAVTVLNGVPTATIAGTQFYVGLGSSPGTMLTSGSTRSVTSVSGGNDCTPQTPETGWWWSTAAGGRGYSIEVAGNHIFFASYLYDVSGRATWQVASGSTSVDGSLFVGKLEGYSGGQTLTGAFRPTTFSGYVGDITIAFSDATHGTLLLPGETLAIERFNIVPNGLSLVAGANQPEAGWWWNPAESGRGFFLEWQGNQLFMAGYMYDDAGNPLWYLSGDGTPSANLLSFANVWQQYGNGQSMGGPYKPPVAVNTSVGPVTIQFSSDEAGLMTLPGGKTTTIQRFRF